MSNWKKENNKWYYIDDNGNKVCSDWIRDENGKWYYADKDGSLVTGWFQTKYNNNWYYAFDKQTDYRGKTFYCGEIVTGWFEDKGKWYYLEEDDENTLGKMYCNCTCVIDGDSYTFDNEGHMLDTIKGVSDALVECSKEFEGYSPVWEDIGDSEMTIGYGTATSGTVGKRLWDSGTVKSCTREQATIWFKEEMNNGAATLISWCKDHNITLKQHQFDACCDVLYNMGFYNFKKFGIEDIVLGNKPSTWNNWKVVCTDAVGNFYPGLVTRRKAEMEIYNNANYGIRP